MAEKGMTKKERAIEMLQQLIKKIESYSENKIKGNVEVKLIQDDVYIDGRKPPIRGHDITISVQLYK